MGIKVELNSSNLNTACGSQNSVACVAVGGVSVVYVASEHENPQPEQLYESDDHSECSFGSTVARASSTDDSNNPLKLRHSAIKRAAGIKGQKVCCYQLCPSPLHSKKWRVITPDTRAGGRDWEPLIDQTLCDSCYSTYRKHGTLHFLAFSFLQHILDVVRMWHACLSPEIARGQAPFSGPCARMRAGSASMRLGPSPQAS